MRIDGLRAALSLATVLVGLTAVACGIPEENEPRAVAPERIPEQLVTAPPNAPSSVDEVGQSATVFMVTTDADDEVTLAPYPITLDAEPSPRALVRHLLTEDNNASLPAELRNQVPDDLALIEGEQEAVIVDDDLVRIRINDEPLQTIQADRLLQAVAQIVFTATQDDGVERVQFIDADGEPIPVNTSDGSKEVVTREDFAELDPDAS